MCENFPHNYSITWEYFTRQFVFLIFLVISVIDKKKIVVIQSVVSSLRPLFMMLLQHGITYRDFSEVCKKAFFQSGRNVLKENNTAETASQLSILTGLHRKDVTDFLEQSGQATVMEAASHPGAALVARWISSPQYLAPDKSPKILPYNGSVSFTTLAEETSKDIRPKAYLDELLRLKIVRQDPNSGEVQLQKEAFIPSEDLEGKLKFFTRNIGDHIAAASKNLEENPPPFFDRSAFHARLTADDLAKIKEYVDKNGMVFLKDFYQYVEALSNQHKPSSETAIHRVTVGLYMYGEEKKHEPEK